MDWTLGRLDAFEYIRVDKTGMERERLEGIRTGSISENLNTSLKASGSLDVVGDLGIGDDFVRVYLKTVNDLGESALFPLGTFLAATPSRTLTDASTTAKVELYSTLLKLEDDKTEQTYTVPAGTNAIAKAAELVEAIGLSPNVTPSTSTTQVDATFEAGTSVLEIVNHLLSVADYRAAYPDPVGAVVLAPYVDPYLRLPVWTFRDDDKSILLPEVVDEQDYYNTPNVVVAVVSNADNYMHATAVNDDPASPYSTVSRGRRIVRVESYTDVATQETLQNKANRLLANEGNLLQHVTIKHTYAPIGIGDVVRLDYRQAGITYDMEVRSREIDLVPGLPTVTKLRRAFRG